MLDVRIVTTISLDGGDLVLKTVKTIAENQGLGKRLEAVELPNTPHSSVDDLFLALKASVSKALSSNLIG